MKRLSVIRLALAFGVTAAILYLGCIAVVMSVSREVTIHFFNSLLHGFDVSSVIRTHMSWGEMGIGIIEVFILGWLVGAVIASVYNLALPRED